MRTRTTLPMDDKGSLLELFSTVVASDICSHKIDAACGSLLGPCMYDISSTVLISTVMNLEYLLPPSF